MQDEFVLIFTEHCNADKKEDKREAEANKIVGKRWNGAVNHYVSEIGYIVIERVEANNALKPLGNYVDRVNDRCCVHPNGNENAPKVSDIPEKYIES